MFDDNNNPQYAFYVKENKIIKFIKITKNELSSIILPKIISKSVLTKNDVNNINKNILTDETKSNLNKYFSGEVKIANKCFSGFNALNIFIPFEASILTYWNAFDKNAEIEFHTSKNLCFKHIKKVSTSSFEHSYERWSIIADKNLSFNGKIAGACFLTENFENNSIKNITLDNSYEFHTDSEQSK